MLTNESSKAFATLADSIDADAVILAVAGAFGCNIFVHKGDIGALMNL